jgi:nucleotide-binding universal stress UspA family protein
MYRHILIPLENSVTDELVLNHVRGFAPAAGIRLTLIHVADGHAARNYHHLHLAPSPEMLADQAYLERRQQELAAAGFTVDAHLEIGAPAAKIVACAEKNDCDLILMATHGHGFFADVFFGSVSRAVRHRTSIPVLFLRAK